MALFSRLGRRLLLFAVVLGAFASVVAPRPATAAPPATQEPKAYILVDADDGRVLAAKDDHESFLTASTVKLLTAVVALERLPLDSTIPVSARAANQPAMKINMHEGEVWKLDDALHSLLVVSANDAAFAIAERASGSVEQFAKDADAIAKRLGARDTTVGDPAGLDDRNSFAGGTHMSAYDLAIVARNVLAVPEIANSAKLLTYDFTDPTGAGRHLTNHNSGFLTTYPGATGLKTGYTKSASRTLVTSATRNGRTMIAVVMGSWDDTGWSGYLLDQGFTTAAHAAGTGVTLPPVRTVTADMRREAFEGLPPALGLPALDGSASVTIAGSKVATSTSPANANAGGPSKKSTTASETRSKSVRRAAPQPASSGFALRFLNLRTTVALVIVVPLLAVFLLRRRAVRRQRIRRIARQKRMAEIRRRRMIDLVEPSDRVRQVRVV